MKKINSRYVLSYYDKEGILRDLINPVTRKRIELSDQEAAQTLVKTRKLKGDTTKYYIMEVFNA